MGTPKAGKSVDARVSTTLQRLERLMGDGTGDEAEHLIPETVEDAVRRLKGRLPDKERKGLGE